MTCDDASSHASILLTLPTVLTSPHPRCVFAQTITLASPDGSSTLHFCLSILPQHLYYLLTHSSRIHYPLYFSHFVATSLNALASTVLFLPSFSSLTWGSIVTVSLNCTVITTFTITVTLNCTFISAFMVHHKSVSISHDNVTYYTNYISSGATYFPRFYQYRFGQFPTLPFPSDTLHHNSRLWRMTSCDANLPQALLGKS